MPNITIADCSTGKVTSRAMTAPEAAALQQAQTEAQAIAALIAGQQQAVLTARQSAAATALNNPTAFLDPAVVAAPTAQQLADAKAQRDAWATMLGVKTLTIPVTQKAAATDVVLM